MQSKKLHKCLYLVSLGPFIVSFATLFSGPGDHCSLGKSSSRPFYLPQPLCVKMCMPQAHPNDASSGREAAGSQHLIVSLSMGLISYKL